MAALAANAVKQKRKREQHLHREQTVASLLLPGTSALVVGWSNYAISIDNYPLKYLKNTYSNTNAFLFYP